MAEPPNNSIDILYSALYEDEEYRPWNGMTTPASDNERNQERKYGNRRRLVDGRVFMNGTPTWYNIKSGGLCQGASGTSSDLQGFKPLNEEIIKLQWEGRAQELGVHGLEAMNSMQDLPVKKVSSQDVDQKKENTQEYPKWSVAEQNASTVSRKQLPTGSGHTSSFHVHSIPSQRYLDQGSSGHSADQSPKPCSLSKGNTDNTWEFHSLYTTDAENSSFNEQLNKSYNDKPLIDRKDQFYTGIPEERRFDEATGNPWGNASNDKEIVAIGTHESPVDSPVDSCECIEESDGEESTKSADSEDVQNHAERCPCEKHNEIGEIEGNSNNVESQPQEPVSSVSTDERRTKRRKRPNNEKLEEESQGKRRSVRFSKVSK